MIKRLTTDLGFETEIVVVPTVREESGLAMSSRNELLSSDDRKKAAIIIDSLRKAKLAFKKGERNAVNLTEMVKKRIGSEPAAQIDYVAVVDRDSLQSVEKIGDEETLIAVAVNIGGVRLIDNVILNRKQ